jgi:hypothetical protein
MLANGIMAAAAAALCDPQQLLMSRVSIITESAARHLHPRPRPGSLHCRCVRHSALLLPLLCRSDASSLIALSIACRAALSQPVAVSSMQSAVLCSLACLLLLLVSVDGQRYFTEVIPTTDLWAAREKANVELVRRTQQFRDGVNADRAVTLTNYMVAAASHTAAQEGEGREGGSRCCCCCLPLCCSAAVRRQHRSGRSERRSVVLMRGSASRCRQQRLTCLPPPLCLSLVLCVTVWASSNGRAWAWVAGWSNGEAHTYYGDTFPNNEEAAHCQDIMYRQYRAGGRFPNEEPTNDGQHCSSDGASGSGSSRSLCPPLTSAASCRPLYSVDVLRWAALV